MKETLFDMDVRSHRSRYESAKRDALEHLEADRLDLLLITVLRMAEHKGAIEELGYQIERLDG